MSAGVKASSALSVGHRGRRSNDYRAHVNAKVRMVQGEEAAGISLIKDALNELFTVGLEINKSLAMQKGALIAEGAGVEVKEAA